MSSRLRGLLAFEDFVDQVGRFINTSNKIDDGWHLAYAENGRPTPYMVKKCLVQPSPPGGIAHRVGFWVQTCETPQPSSAAVVQMVQQQPSQDVYRKQQQQQQQNQEQNQHSSHEQQLFDRPSFHVGQEGQKDTSCMNSIVSDIIEDEHDNSDGFLQEMEMEGEGDDCVAEIPQRLQTTLTYEYHVVYSESYSVPVLYFNVFTPDGKLLPLEDVWRRCPSNYHSFMEENKWTTLTQQEHPLLGRPFLQLHPCHTADLMAQVCSTEVGDSSKRNYLVTWLSTVGPVVSLKISHAYLCTVK